MINATATSVFPDSKKHYEILDGLRGVAALTVVLFHILEIFSGNDHTRQIINHGYLAVDFFFVLSGFVVGHAYDDRWGNMSLGEFFKRRSREASRCLPTISKPHNGWRKALAL